MEQLWSEEAWKASEHIYREILNLPFLQEMASGELSRERFLRYLEQDRLYLEEYSRVLAHIASRLERTDDVATFLRFADDGVAMERILHNQYLGDRQGAERSPSCMLYTSLLKAQAPEDVAVEVAAILPCFRIYQQVGEHILKIARMDGNPYAQWISAYSDEGFAESTRRCTAIADRLAAEGGEGTRRRMTDIYTLCSRMEYLFWDSAYRLESWPANIL